jgi:ankyrin repeat protein
MRLTLKAGAAAAALILAASVAMAQDAPRVPGQRAAPELVQAAKDEDREATRALLRQGADPNAAEVDGTTALHWAAHHGDAELAERLLRRGADANAANEYGALPMQEAAVLGDADMIRVLLNGGADVESPNPEGQTALMAVARTGRTDAAQLLIRAGADVNAREDWGGQTALMWAITQRHPDMVGLLIEAGADVNARATVRDWERHMTSEPRIKELHTGGLTPLLYAAREGCLPCARTLVEAGAEVDRADPDGITPLMLALMNMRYDTAAFLIGSGADVNRWDRWGRTALFDAVDTNGLFNPATRALQPLDDLTAEQVAAMLLERGARPDMRLKVIPPERSVVGDRVFNDHILDVGATPLLRAAWGGDVEMTRILLDSGARVDIPNGRGALPVLAAVSDRGTRVPGRTEERTIATLELLVAAGASLEATNKTGQRAAHLAVRGSMPTVVRWLAAQGADLDALDDRGRDLMAYASGGADINEFGTTDIVGVLPEMQALVQELTGQAIPES